MTRFLKSFIFVFFTMLMVFSSLGIAKNIDNKTLVNEDKIPVKIPMLLSAQKITYPKEALKNNIEGIVLIKVVVNKEGLVDNAVIVQSSGNELLDNATLEAVLQYRFAPAINKQGAPVPCNVNFPINFSMKKSYQTVELYQYALAVFEEGSNHE